MLEVEQHVNSTLYDVKLDFTYNNSYFYHRGVSEEVFYDFNLGKVISILNKRLPKEILNAPAFPVYDENCIFIGWIFRPGTSDLKYRYHGLKTFDHVYGLDKAIPYILQYNSVILVEGPFDVLLAHSAGMKNVVAILGSVISVNQLLLLGSYTNKFILALDSDKAGLDGMNRSINLINKILPDITVERMLLYPYKDFADFILKTKKL